jgi:hypothetical protein
MKLIPKEIESTLPPLYSQENVSDPVAIVKFFDPCGRYTFYVPVVGPLAEIINRRIERRLPDCSLIFHWSGRSFKASQGGLPKRFNDMWKMAYGSIGAPDLRVYDLRRSAVRNLIHSGVPELTAMKISGHKSRETFRRYAIEDPSELAAAIEKVSGYVTPQMKRRGKVVPFSKRRRNTGTTRARRFK